MKKLAISVLLSLVIVVSAPPLLLGFNIWHLGHAVKVATSLTAKLTCSGYYISGFSPKQMRDDLTSYSPVTELVDVQFNSNNSVTTALFGLAETTATFHPKYGCTLNLPNSSALAVTPNLKDKQFSNQVSQSWPTGSARTDIDTKLQSLLEHIIESDNKQNLNSRAMVVIQEGKLVAEAYAQGVKENTLLLGWSMAKSVIAMAQGRAEYLGLVTPTQSELFTQWTDQRANITLEQLLTMTSGLAFSEDYAPGSDATHMLFTAPSASDVALKSPLQYQPGSFFSYSSGTSNLLARFMMQNFNNEQESLYAFMNNELFAPLGIKKVYFEPDASGVPIASSYLYATASDWARLGWLMANKGQINNQRLLAEDWVLRASSPNKSNNEQAYGYQFWLNQGDDTLRWPQLPKDAYAMMGNRKQFLMIVPSKQLVFVRLGWSSGEYPMEDNTATILSRID